MGKSAVVKNPVMVQDKIQVFDEETRLILCGAVEDHSWCEADGNPLKCDLALSRQPEDADEPYIPNVIQDPAVHPLRSRVAVMHTKNLPVGGDGRCLRDPGVFTSP